MGWSHWMGALSIQVTTTSMGPAVNRRAGMSEEYTPTPLDFERVEEGEMRRRSRDLLEALSRRRSIRSFSTDAVPRELIDQAIEIASTAPSGAHRQPWHFVVVDDADLKKKIRDAAEQEERRSYDGRMPQEWLDALKPLGTDAVKVYLEDAPYIVVLFAETQQLAVDGTSSRNYYVSESVGIAAGLFITALHLVGLATLTHTPSPMGFLREILQRPRTERPYLLFPVGYPAEGCMIPDLQRKSLSRVRSWNLDGRSEELS
ncbi:MAG: nitroreductase family protein [Planctomycetota bacterium]|nr:nitroreductase family protein [Planctomycetota bacterium]